MDLGYARVSVTEKRQGTHIETQVDALLRAGVHPSCIYQDDDISGARRLYSRPGWKALAAVLQRGDDVLMMDVSRLSRYTIDGLLVVREDLREQRGVGVYFLTGLDLRAATPDADLQLTIQLGIAEHQREVISVKTKKGLVKARERGEILGRRPEMTAERAERAAELLGAGGTAVKTAAALGVSLPTLRKWRKENGF